MFSLMLAILYLTFISLGLPDSLLGSAWPTMRITMDLPISYAGIVSMIIAGGTIISSLLSDRLTKKWGAGPVTAVSVLTTAAALFGFSSASAFWQLCLFAIPYGLGGGAVDAALNNYVALHYASRHMNWLHFFWGVGASISPYIMGFYLTNSQRWQDGYRTVSLIQLTLAVGLFVSLPLWRGTKNTVLNNDKPDETIPDQQASTPIPTTTPTDAPTSSHNAASTPTLSLMQILRVNGVKQVLLAFFCYCALECTAGLWASSYLVLNRGLTADIAARYASFFFLGITGGRFLCGFIANQLGDKRMIQIGIAIIFVGIAAIWLPLDRLLLDWLRADRLSFDTDAVCLAGLIIIGLGCAPIYPSIIHATPAHFGADKSQAIVGVQMASAYTGATFMPPIFGLIANHINVGLYPAFLLLFAVVMLVMTQWLNKAVLSRQSPRAA